MILEEIRLTDFRCFHGKTVLRFATDEQRNVTIIYAENGLGKTTLLNALLWCFYGDTTSRFEKKDDIVNYDARRSGRTRASVEVLFEHEGDRYIAKRYFGNGIGNGDARPFVVARLEYGGEKSLSAPETFINSVVPRDMAHHFLFDGEHAEVLLGEDNRNKVRAAIRDILGCTLVETAIKDLKDLSNDFRKQIPSTPATKRIAELNERQNSLEAQEEFAAQELERLLKDRGIVDEQKRDIEEKLRTTAAAKAYQESRERLQLTLGRAMKRRNEALDEAFRWLGENGRFVVSKKITEEAFEFLDEKQHRGRIPSPYNEEFVRDLLAETTCICGAHLSPGSDAAKRVADLLQRAANQVQRDRIAKVRARLTNLRTERLKAPARLAKANERVVEATDEISSLESQLGEISEKLKGIDLEEVKAQEIKREQLERDLSNMDRQIGVLKKNIADAQSARQKIDLEINTLARQDQQTAIYVRRRELCDQVREILEQKLVDEEATAKSVLRAAIRKVLESTTKKVLKLKMTDDYVVSLVDTEGTALPKSGGENQLLGLVFTAALVEFATVRKSAQDFSLLPGTIAPLVLDSPFGALDPAYKVTTASYIPKMARQVVLLMSRSQGTSDVLSALRDHVGVEHVLVRHNKAPRGDRQPERHVFGSKEVEIALFEAQFDGTSVMEVRAR